MITLSDHIKYTQLVEKGSLDSLPMSEKVKIMREMSDVYPLKEAYDIDKSVTKNFIYYDNVMELTLGQFIMIEQIMTGKFKFAKEVDMEVELAKYILRPLNEIEFDNTDKQYEAVNVKNILSLPVQSFYNAINKFLRNREHVLFKQFAGVFYETPTDDDDDDNGIDTQAQQEASFQQQWYWYSIVRELAQEDIRRYDEIYMLKMKTVLPEMSYLAQKNKIEAANQRASAAMNRL
jgi:hypothetical protein